MSDNYDNYHLFLDALKECLHGVPYTLLITAVSAGLGLLLAVFLTVLLQSPFKPLRGIVRLFIFFFTGSPFLVQLYIFYYGLPNLSWINQLMQSPSLGILQEAWAWVCMALILNTAAYTAVIFSGYVRSMDRGELEAARSCGMSRWLTVRRVMLPSALRKSLPAYSNEVISVLHATALASAVTVPEITGKAIFFNQTYYPPEYIGFGAAAVWYLILNTVLIGLFRLLEKRYAAHLQLNSTH